MPKHNHRLETIHSQEALDVIIVDMMLGHVFFHLQNCPFTVNLIANPRSIVG
jgi:hypothetical protein